MDDLTIIIPYHNGEAYIRSLLTDIPATIPVLVVDDLSDTPFACDLPNVRVVRMTEKGYFSGAVNRGLLETQTDVLVLNQDSRLQGDAWLTHLAQYRPHYVIIGDPVNDHPAWPNGYVQGTFMFLRREAIQQVGLLDAEWFPLWGATNDWQLRAVRQGFAALPRTVPGFKHLRNGTVGSSIRQTVRMSPRSPVRFFRNPPLFSIVIPSLNYGRFLPDAVASLMGGPSALGTMSPQTIQAFEIIIVDDGSLQDEQLEITQSLADPWKGIRVLRHQRTQGTGAANNTGIRAAYGSIVTTMSADDMREADALERMYRLQRKNPHAFVYDDVRLFTGNTRGKVWQMEDFDFEKLLLKNQVHAGIMFPKKAWVETGGYPEVMKHGREDWAFNVALGQAGYCGLHLREPGYLYRREAHNRTLRNTTPDWRAFFLDQMQALYPDLYKGVRPKMCCGNGSGTNVPATVQSRNVAHLATADLVGMEGFTYVVYQGDNSVDTPFFGPVTGKKYQFSSKRPIGRVANEDLRTRRNTGILEIMNGPGRPFFLLYDLSQVEPVSPETPLVSSNHGAEGSEEALGLYPIEGTMDVTANVLEKLLKRGFATWDVFLGWEAEAIRDETGLTLTQARKVRDYVASLFPQETDEEVPSA